MRGFFYDYLRRPSVWAVTLSTGFGLGLTSLWAIPTGPQANDRQVTRVVSKLMLDQHLSKHAIDDEISQRGLKLFLKSLDPMKVYFTQGDIDEFMKKQNDLDDALKNGDISFAYVVFNRLLQRIDERVKLVDELLKETQDFTQDEDLVTDPEKLTYAKNDAEVRDRWRKRIKYDYLILKGDKVDAKVAQERLGRRYHSFAKRMQQTDGDEILEMYVTALTTSFDPHTTYMSPSSLENFRIMMSLELEGIGAALQVTDGYTVVSKIIPGGACEKCKEMKVEDRIVSVGQGETGEMVDVVDMKLNDVVKMIRGKAGTIVRLGVIPTGGTETKIVKITRAKIELTDSEARGVILEDGKKVDGSPYKIGVIDLPSFYMDMEGAREGKEDFKSTTRDCRKLLDEFRAKGVDAVVMDLRRNGGGSLSEAISLTGLFIDQGPVVQVKDPDGQVQHLDDMERGVAWDGPLVIMTSKFSASASEILAGAIQDYHRGLIVGDEATHGKGTVQSLLDLGGQLFRIPNPPNLGALKITMQQFYRPNGDSTQKRGVLADVVLPSVTNHMDVSEGDLEYALAFDQVPSARFKKGDLVSKDVVEQLKVESAERRAKSADFQKLLKNIDRYVEQKTKKRVTLNEEKYFAQRAELDADKEDEKQFEEQANSKEVVKRDYYFNEVLNITVDYIKALKGNKLAIK
ncbi:MAG TPA: carboxy terminal-processing peptidase [Pirellulaceae bacterium]|nr:carboxy terminal-processing peptidase [Pirellulaceae bacterium]